MNHELQVNGTVLLCVHEENVKDNHYMQGFILAAITDAEKKL